MNKAIVASLILCVFSSCDNPPSTIGEYVYMEGDLVHSYKNCKVAGETTIARSRDLFQNTHKHNGKYYRVADFKNTWEVRFCSSCISELMMNAMEDSIAKYDNHYDNYE